MEMNTTATNSHNWYILLYGLPRPIEAVTLAPGLTIRPLESELTVFDLAAAGAVGFKEWALLEPMVQQCSCEIESARDEAFTPGYNTLNRAWLASALLCLRGYNRHFGLACSSYSWNRISGHQKKTSKGFRNQLEGEGVRKAVFDPIEPLPKFEGNLLDFHLKYLITQYSNEADDISKDAQWIRENYESFNQLASNNNAFKFALQASVDWRYATDPRSGVARLWSGIESLFAIQSELVYRIALHASSLLEPRGKPRKQRFQEVKKLYNLRSKVVHGNDLTEKQIQHAVDESYRLLRDLLLYCIGIGGIPNSDRIIDELLG